MTTVKNAVESRTDPLTVRIYAAIARRGLSCLTVQGLTGIEGTRWRRRARTGDWSTKEAQAIDHVLGVSFDELIGLTQAAPDKRCGQERGYYAHRRRNEKPCPACCKAHALRNTVRYATAFETYRLVAS